MKAEDYEAAGPSHLKRPRDNHYRRAGAGDYLSRASGHRNFRLLDSFRLFN